MKIHVLTRRQSVPAKLDEVFSFFQDAHNLSRITPPSMGFQIITPVKVIMRAGALIDYIVRINGLPFRWTTLITEYDAPNAFADVQLTGPYSYWHHHHTFTEIEGGTEVSDTVHYALPAGVLGTIVHVLFVRSALSRIFDYRAAVIKDVFGGEAQKGIDMNILVAGANGFIGPALVRELAGRGHGIVALVRNVDASSELFPPGVVVEAWDGRTSGDWRLHMENVDAVVNLAGASIGAGRWTERRKKLILESRINATRAIVQAIRASKRPPRVLVNASAVGYYGMSGEGVVTEESDPGNDFLAKTCQMWESEANVGRESNVRVVFPRFGVVLAAGGGALKKMLLPFELFVGGPLGSGRQWYSWIHRDDAIGAILHFVEHAEIEGAVNVVAPESATMAAFAKELGRVLGRPSWMRVPAWVLKLLLGEMAGMILEGRQIKPVRLIRSGFAYRYPTLRGALEAILG